MEINNINGSTQFFAILGDPIIQTSTPGLINTIFSEKQHNKVLIPIHSDSKSLKEVVLGLQKIKNFKGAVITMPHKAAIVPYLDKMSEEVVQSQACNVIRRSENGELHGHMLDGEGFVSGLIQQGHEVRNKNIFLIGAGGAATGIAFSLCKNGVNILKIYNRSKRKAEILKGKIDQYFPHKNIELSDEPDEKTDILINATSLGMNLTDKPPISIDRITSDTLVAEVIIKPEMTSTLIEAQKKGCQIHQGIHMLKAQLRLMLDFMDGVK
ncbi:shikimate dehydrogenase family protein [Aquiflexum lacus]|uniref:shikimate dehydrogenase family protein n=1 Tax=Aquiflexum lacus TaxID=2483805 RepID=UPI0018931C4D|nr:shikimate dehydrogenase [Aquiflexum lacus]